MEGLLDSAWGLTYSVRDGLLECGFIIQWGPIGEWGGGGGFLESGSGVRICGKRLY